MAERRNAKELWDLYADEEVTEVHEETEPDDHGYNQTLVLKEGERFWQVTFVVQGGGDYHSWRDGDAEDAEEVWPHTKTVTVYHTQKKGSADGG